MTADLQTPSRNRSHRGWGRLCFGAILVALGVIFLLDERHILDAGQILTYWPVIPIVLGLFKILSPGASGNRVFGGLLLLGGLLFLGQSFGLYEVDGDLIFPGLLMLIGGAIIWRGLGRTGTGDKDATTDPSATHALFAFWSGIQRRVTSNGYRGGDATAIMGGIEIDLRSARTAPGEAAIIDVFVMWGGIEVKVPADWNVVFEGTAIMGAYEDTRTQAPSENETRPGVPNLILRGLVLMGGLELKR